jgi:hypothetical protein
MMNQDQLIRMLRDIVEGKTKAESSQMLAPDDAVLWDTIAAEVAEMQAAGVVVDIPFESTPPPTEPISKLN